MGKSVASERVKPKRKDAKRLAVSSGYMKSLANFVKRLERDGTDQSSQVILPKVHDIIKKNKKKISFDYRKLKEKLRICKQCDKWNQINLIIQCAICQNNYHNSCLGIEGKPHFICSQCELVKKDLNRCGKCKKKIVQQEKKQCSECKLIFHDTCWKGKQKKCNKCINLQKQERKAKKFDPSIYKKQITNQDTIFTAQSALFRYQRLIKTQKDLTKYTNSLIQAIKGKNMLYSQDLVNIEEFKDIFDENSMDFGINMMRKPEEQAYKQYKKFPIGPYIFQKIEGKGYDVVADKTIPDKSLICEYVGEVVTLRNKNKNDSLMQLQSGKNSEETLIIRPERFTNMARFINGVRKNSSEGNVETMKLLCRGKPLVLLVAKREIKKGESLCYDYNAGGIAAEYDTSHFL